MRVTAALFVAALLLAAACSGGGGGHPAATAPAPGLAASPATAAPVTTSTTAFGTPQGPAALAPGSDPSVLPGPVLIADRSNNRLIVVDPQGRLVWQFPRPGDLAPGQTFNVPDDAFFSPDGRQIIATQEDDFTISVIDVASHRIVYRYGTPGVHGSGPGHLWNPDDAMLLPDGSIVTADIKNCRVLVIGPAGTAPATVIGQTTSACRHDPPARWGSPNGAFPMANGDWLVTEINGDWVDELTPMGTVVRSWHPPGISYPSDSNEVSPGTYVTVDYTSPGTVEEFDAQGRLVWRYAQGLNHPSLAEPLPNGDILLNDDDNDRVIVIDPRTDRVAWQYGATHHPGSAPGLLNDPDGVDLVPPYSLLVRHAGTLTTPSGP